MHNSILNITSTTNNNFGTCFAISSNSEGTHLVTCGHVINNCGDNFLVDGKPASVVSNHYAKGLDIAVIYVKGLTLKAFTFSHPFENQGYTVTGFTALGKDIKKEPIENIRIKENIEIIKRVQERKITAIKLYTPEAISSGYSGSPIICKHSNSVVGIVNLQSGSETNYGISSVHIKEVFDIEINTPPVTEKKKLITDINEQTQFYIDKTLTSEFDHCLSCFSTQNSIWNEPKLYDSIESRRDGEASKFISIQDIINTPTSTIINANQQSGLSSLARYMIKEAWESAGHSFWFYLDVNDLKPYTKDVLKHVNKRLKDFNLSFDDIACVVIDEVSNSVSNIQKILSAINELFINTPIIVMMSCSDNPLITENIEFHELRHFDKKYLWTLSRNEIRNVVTLYNKSNKHIGNDDTVINRLTSDLEVLNIPRTPLNCLTILKIYELEFDETPINRTAMIGKVLYILFNVDDIPKYKSRPDLMDTEYVLGFFCEKLIREHQFYFSRSVFLNVINKFCKDSEIDLETDVIFDVLFANNIIIQRAGEFCFKFSYWIFYFAAHRMHKNKAFANFILNDMHYTSYPEIIEYYTGITRSSDYALNIIKQDIISTRHIVENKCQLPDEFDIYGLLRWSPSPDVLESVKQELSSGALKSQLPDEIKDYYADKSYDNVRPMKQSITKILEEYSLLRLMKTVHAGSRALRNSDYAQVSLKHELLNEIVKSWEQIIKVQILIAPLLSKSRSLSVDGANFSLGKEFIGSEQEILNELILSIPQNVIQWFEDDIFSKKMGTLLFNNANRQVNELTKHTLGLLITLKRPNGWEKFIEEYLSSLDKNSYYLSSMFNLLNQQYQYSFASRDDLTNTVKLIKISMAKHDGVRNINKKEINKISDRVLPQRIED